MKIETNVEINCDLTVSTDYQWKIKDRTSNRYISMPGVEPILFKRQILYLPARSMSYGNYTAELVVSSVEYVFILKIYLT